MLAGGVAHDFNNLLTVILNGVALAKLEASAGVASTAHLDAVALAGERAADLCRQMLAYAGRTQLARAPVELSALVGEMSSMLEASIARRATLVRELAPGLPALLGDATQIRQVVMNLVLNASESISGSSGTIHVSTGTGTYDAASFARSAAGGKPKAGPYVWLEVRDDGVGMDAPTVAQMFDPFFTTKFVGRGLGMAAVLGILRGHERAIDVDSAPGQAHGFASFSRPAARSRSARPTPAEDLAGDRGRAPRGRREERADHDRAPAPGARLSSDSSRATASKPSTCSAPSAGPIGAVLLDLTMPRMDGIGP